MVNYKFILAILCVPVMSLCMEEEVQQPADAGMVPIRHWKAVKPYAGSFVAYTAAPEAKLLVPIDVYTFPSNSEIKFGWISPTLNVEDDGITPLGVGMEGPIQKRGGDGYLLEKLIKMDGLCRLSRLTDHQVRVEASLSMRFASRDEVRQIKEALSSGQARFELGNSETQLDEYLSTGLKSRCKRLFGSCFK
jgi:hypothetical protein